MSTKTELRTTARDQKRQEARRALAEHAINTLADLGYANFALRDISAASGVSLGKLQYYFEDKDDLLLYCIDLYMDKFILSLEDVLKSDLSHQAAKEIYIDLLVSSIKKNATIHRLWFDIRNQAFFDKVMRDKVEQIENGFVDICSKLAVKFGLNSTDGLSVYLMVDAIYRYYIQKVVYGDKIKAGEVRKLLETALVG